MSHRRASIGFSLACLGTLAATAPARAEPQLQIEPKAPRTGDPVLITVTGVDRAPRGTGGKVPLVFFHVRDGWQAAFALPVEDDPKDVKIVITHPALSQTLIPAARKWGEENVTIDPEMAEPPADKRKIIDADNGAIIKALREHVALRFQGKFTLPGSGQQTSGFGSWRTLNGGFRARHLGLDLGVRKGTPVHAIEDGQVTLVRDGFLTGGTVVVAHGAGIASTYFHLDDIQVHVGDVIQRNAVIGKVGLTGRTTGPHIHLAVWVPGGFIDPAVFLHLKIGAPVQPATK
ncbi:MAG TPA: M23 family metallopeptidase [Kofleriaceae bacterium]|nr:M23 family metallopeptidase [Kofleriaceae bacterium]